ncbi:MAG: hypothetical protein JSS14_22095 [Proteobacteria bacterium]|nr:hypothetical protein [Pseudomonadota bacterium]
MNDAEETLWAQVAIWLEFSNQKPCRFKSLNDCKMHAHFKQDPEAIALLEEWKTFQAYKRLTR